MAGYFVVEERSVISQTAASARDPGVRGGASGAGGAYSGLTQNQLAIFQVGLEDLTESDSLRAIQAHRSGSAVTRNASEATGVIQRFNGLSEAQKQDILNFLRSL